MALPITEVTMNAMTVFELSMYGIAFIISLTGMISNIINMIVFKKLQTGDPINTNLLGLAVSDFIICFTAALMVLLLNPYSCVFLLLHFGIFPKEILTLYIGIPHTLFVRITIWITAITSFQRCLCVVLPLKIKAVLTVNRARISVLFCFVLSALIAIPIYYTNRLKWVFVPPFNATYYRRVLIDDYYTINSWFTPLETVFLHILPFSAIFVCTTIMIRRLKRNMEWRQTTSSSAAVQANFVKQIRIIKMVVVMSIVFLVCYVHNIAIFIMSSFDVGFDVSTMDEIDWFRILGLVFLVLNTLSCNINIFIYYSHSSKYKEMFQRTFGRAIRRCSCRGA